MRAYSASSRGQLQSAERIDEVKKTRLVHVVAEIQDRSYKRKRCWILRLKLWRNGRADHGMDYPMANGMNLERVDVRMD